MKFKPGNIVVLKNQPNIWGVVQDVDTQWEDPETERITTGYLIWYFNNPNGRLILYR